MILGKAAVAAEGPVLRLGAHRRERREGEAGRGASPVRALQSPRGLAQVGAVDLVRDQRGHEGRAVCAGIPTVRRQVQEGRGVLRFDEAVGVGAVLDRHGDPPLGALDGGARVEGAAPAEDLVAHLVERGVSLPQHLVGRVKVLHVEPHPAEQLRGRAEAAG